MSHDLSTASSDRKTLISNNHKHLHSTTTRGNICIDKKDLVDIITNPHQRNVNARVVPTNMYLKCCARPANQSITSDRPKNNIIYPFIRQSRGYTLYTILYRLIIACIHYTQSTAL